MLSIINLCLDLSSVIVHTLNITRQSLPVIIDLTLDYSSVYTLNITRLLFPVISSLMYSSWASRGRFIYCNNYLNEVIFYTIVKFITQINLANSPLIRRLLLNTWKLMSAKYFMVIGAFTQITSLLAPSPLVQLHLHVPVGRIMLQYVGLIHFKTIIRCHIYLFVKYINKINKNNSCITHKFHNNALW